MKWAHFLYLFANKKRNGVAKMQPIFARPSTIDISLFSEPIEISIDPHLFDSIDTLNDTFSSLVLAKSKRTFEKVILQKNDVILPSEIDAYILQALSGIYKGYCHIAAFITESILKKMTNVELVKTVRIVYKRSDHYFNVIKMTDGKKMVVDTTWIQFLDEDKKKGPFCLVGEMKEIQEFLMNKKLSRDLMSFYQVALSCLDDPNYFCWQNSNAITPPRTKHYIKV